MTSGTSAASCLAAARRGRPARSGEPARRFSPPVRQPRSQRRPRQRGATLAIISESALGRPAVGPAGRRGKASHRARHQHRALRDPAVSPGARRALRARPRNRPRRARARTPGHFAARPADGRRSRDGRVDSASSATRTSGYWKDLRVALPRSASLPIFDHRVDVLQAGVVALSLILGRGLHDDDYPTKVPELVGSAWANSAAGDLQPLPSSLRSWLSRALQIELRTAFTSVAEAAAEFEHMLSTIGYAAEPVHLERFLARCQEKTGSTASAPAPSPSMVPPGKTGRTRRGRSSPRAASAARRARRACRSAPRRTGAPARGRTAGRATLTRHPASRRLASKPLRALHRQRWLNRPRVSSSRRLLFPEFEAYPFGTPAPVEKTAKSDTSRFESHAPNGFFRWFPFHSRSGGDARYAVAQIA